MALPVFELLSPIEKVTPPGVLDWEGSSEDVKEARESYFVTPERTIIITEWEGLLHEVIYQAPLEGKPAIDNRNDYLFRSYGDGHSWKEILDNGFGKTYRREDSER